MPQSRVVPVLTSAAAILEKLPAKAPCVLKAVPISPAKEYREQMRRLRRQFNNETRRLQARQQELQKKTLALKQEKLALLKQKIHAHAQPAAPEEREDPIEFDPIRPARNDPVFEHRRQVWREFRQKQAEMRVQNHTLALQRHSQDRLEKLLYLFYAAEDFVTYSNMNSKIEAVTASLQLPPPSKRIAHMVAQHQELAFRKRAETRASELEQAMEGTVANGKPDITRLQEVAGSNQVASSKK